MAWDGDIAGAIDLAHAARAELLDNAVVCERLANHGGQPPFLPAILARTPTQVNAPENQRRLTRRDHRRTLHGGNREHHEQGK